MKLLRVILFGLVLALPAVCNAQWQWLDKDGHKVFSDKAPPPEVPAKNILRQPGVKAPSVANMPAAPDAAASAAKLAKSAASAPRVSGKDKTLEDKKKIAEAAEADAKKAQEEEAARLRAENCARAKTTKAGFESGARLARINDKGEREYLDDATRARENKRLDAVIASDCKPAGG